MRRSRPSYRTQGKTRQVDRRPTAQDQIPSTRPVESPSRGTPSTPIRSSMLRYRLLIGCDLNLTWRPAENVPPAAAGQDDRQVGVGMAVAVGIAAAVDDHRIVKQRLAVDVFDRVHFFEEPGELLHVPPVDLGDLVHHLFLVAMMGQVVMALGDIDLGEGPVAPLVGQQEGGDAGGVGLEGQDHHVEHELDVLPETCAGMPARRFHGGVRDVLELFGPFQPAFDFPDAGQVFVELLLIVAAELLLERTGVVEDEIEDRALLLAAELEVLAALAGAPAPKRRSKTRRGLGSGDTGKVGVLHDRLYW